MARTPGPTLTLRRQTWFIRYYVPKDQQGLIGKAEITRTLGTHDKREAQQRLHAAALSIQREIATLIGSTAPSRADPAFIEHEAQKLRALRLAGEIDEETADRILDLDLDAHLDTYPPSQRDAQTGWPINPRGDLQQIVATSFRAVKDLKFKPLGEWIDLRMKDAEHHLRPKTVAAKKLPLRLLREHFGSARDPRTIKRADAAEFVRECITQKAEWSIRTKELRLDHVKEFFNWLETQLNEDEFTNPFLRVKVTKGTHGQDGKTRRGFTNREIETLLLSDFPMPYLSALVVLALYSGARLEELCARTVGEVMGDGEAFRISTGKNAHSVRTLPIHPIAQPLVSQLARTSFDGFIISGLRPGPHGGRGHRVSTVFKEWRKRLGIDGPDTVFHSFRNTFITAGDRVGLHREQVNQITGHASQSMGAHYVDAPEVQRIAAHLNRVTYGERIDAIARALVAAHGGNPSKRTFRAQSLKPVPSRISMVRVET